jgi:hypothetical protein
MTIENVPLKQPRTKMAMKEQAEKNRTLERQHRETFHALLREQVIHRLGQPANLLDVRIHVLWGDYYRVNVLIGPDIVSAKVANSYFLSADSDGNIVKSTPKIIKQY